MQLGVTRNGRGVCVVTVEGLKELQQYLKTIDPVTAKLMDKGLIRAGSFVLRSAQLNATALGGEGKLRASLSIKKRTHGIALHASDEAAAVKEFAHRGACTITSKGTPLANARLRLHSGVGVPKGNPPRVLIPAVEDNVSKTLQALTNAIEKYADEVLI